MLVPQGRVAMQVGVRLGHRPVMLMLVMVVMYVAVIVLDVREADWTEGGAFWQVGVPGISSAPTVVDAHARMVDGLQAQRRGI